MTADWHLLRVALVDEGLRRRNWTENCSVPARIDARNVEILHGRSWYNRGDISTRYITSLQRQRKRQNLLTDGDDIASYPNFQFLFALDARLTQRVPLLIHLIVSISIPQIEVFYHLTTRLNN